MADEIEFVPCGEKETLHARRESLRLSTRKKTETVAMKYREEQSDDDDDDEDDDDLVDNDEVHSESEEGFTKPIMLDHGTPVCSKDVYGFVTPKRTGSLAQAAADAVHSRTPLTANKSRTNSGQVGSKRKADKNNNTEKQSHRRNSRAKVKVNEESSDSSGSDGDSSESEDESGKTARTDAEHGEEDMSTMLEEYFSAHKTSGCLTSDRTLAKLRTPRMDQETLLATLRDVETSHPLECARLYQKHKKLFHKWMFQLRNDFNLLLHGLGSKRVLIDQFRASILNHCTQLVVNGYFPSLTIKNVLNCITEDYLGYGGSFKNVIDQCTFIKQRMLDKDQGQLDGFFIIIHNIDGPMLRSKRAQTTLSLLAEIPRLHVVASVDHINGPLIWNQCQLSRFNWLWYDVTTFETYIEETSYENSLLVQHSGTLALSSLTHVFRSLTPNARKIFMLIADHQLAEKSNSSYIGLSFHDCYRKCRSQFLVHSDVTLRTQLTEFRDHKLINSRKGADGVEYLYIPLDATTLKQFKDEQENT